MTVRIENSFEPITEEQLIAFEQELSITLPDDYSQFLLAHNGGRPGPCVFKVEIDGYILRTSIDSFYGFKIGDVYSFPKSLEAYKGRLPISLLPFAEGATGLACLSVSGDGYGKVYYWDRNREGTDREPDYSNVYLLADSFTEFLEMLYDPDEDA